VTLDFHTLEEVQARRNHRDLYEPELPYWLDIGPITWPFAGLTAKRPAHVHFDGGQGLALCDEHFALARRGQQWLTSEEWDDVTCRNCWARKGWSPQPIKVTHE
jgi:hypothetical protein